jgi:hypothetical protein
MSEPMQPVWIAFPRIPWGSIGWRMGAGEDYWHAWAPWFRSLPEAERDAYKSEWPEPDGWKDFYSFIETGKLPGWFLERQQKIADAAIPPTPDEDVIEDYHRVLWLIRQHLKRVGADQPLPEESIAEVYQGPDGTLWRLSSHATRGGMRLVRQAR